MNNTVYRLLSLIIALAVAFGGSISASAAGNVYYVSATGRDTNPGTSAAPFKTFAKAVSALKPGDTLQVVPGTYYEPLNLKPTTLGTASAPINVIGNGAIVDMRAIEQTGIKISGSYINVSGFEVKGARNAGIGIPGKYITVKNNVVHDNVTDNGIGTCGTSTTGWSSAVKVGIGGQNITIENNRIYRNCGEGIAITRGVNVIVQNNTVYDNFAPNIYIDNSPFSTVQDNQVYCTGAVLRRDGTRPTGIGLGEEFYEGWGAQMHDILVTGNTVRDCSKGIGAFASEVGGTFTNVTITGNTVPSGFARPIALSTSPNRNVVVSYNTIYTDMYISDPVGISLIGNTIGGVTAPTATSVSAPTSTQVVLSYTPAATQPAATSIVVPTATSLPILTSTPTSIPSQAPTDVPAINTPVQSGTDAIFASNFENGGLSEWSANVNGGGDLSVSPAAALVGSNGLQVVINDNNALSVTSDQPNAEPRYRARFYFDPNSISMANGDSHIIVRGYGGGSTIVLRVEFGFSNGAYRIRAGVLNDGTAWTETNWVNLSDGPHAVELDWRASAGDNNGGLTLWVDNAQQADLTGIDNDTRRMERVMLGALASIDSGTRGTYYFDAFDSRRESYIGP